MGTLSVAIFVDFSDKSINIDQWGGSYIDLSGWVGAAHAYSNPLQGVVTDNTPVDMVQWGTTAKLSPSGMEHWQSCLELLVHA